MQYINNFLKYRGLLSQLVLRDIKVKYKRSVLGLLWSVLNPLLTMTVMAIVFSQLFRFDIENFAAYLITGQIMFNFFSEATNMAMKTIMENASLIKKVYIPKYIFTISRNLSSLVNLAFSFIAVLIVVIFSGIKFNYSLVFAVLSLIYIFTFAAGVSLVLSAVAVFFRDVVHLYGVLLTAWMYLTPIFYPISIVPARYLFLIKINPLYYYIEHFRTIILLQKVPSLQLNGICLLISLLSLLIGLRVFFKLQDRFILYI